MADVDRSCLERQPACDEQPVADSEHPGAAGGCQQVRRAHRFHIDISRVEAQNGRRNWRRDRRQCSESVRTCSARSCPASGAPASGRRCFSGRLPLSGRRPTVSFSARNEDGPAKSAQRRGAEAEPRFLLRQYTELARQVRELLEERAERQSRCEAASRALASDRAELWRTRAELSSEKRQGEALAAENRELARELTVACQAAQLRAQELLVQQATTCSGFSVHRTKRGAACPGSHADFPEGQLRRVLGNPRATTSELQEAVKAVDALLQEAKREISSRELRERRAAIQELYDAIDGGEENPLTAALERARRAEVHAVDIEKGEDKLAELRLMTPEQKATKVARSIEEERKRQAFILVKRDDLSGLEVLVSSVGAETRWRDWRDHAGRTLWQYSLQMRAEKVRPLLQPKSAQTLRQAHSAPYQRADDECCGTPPREPVVALETTPECLARPPPRQNALEPAATKMLFDEIMAPPAEVCVVREKSEVCVAPQRPPGPSPLVSPTHTCPRHALLGSPTASSGASPEPSPCTSPCAPGEGRELRSRAFKAVVRDDAAVLGEVLAAVDLDVWSAWRNGAGVGLFALSKERGASNSYSVLANALGLLEELPRERFEEKDAVWVFTPGDVQPRRASVVADAEDDSDEVLVEFWEGSEAAARVSRCLLRKT